MKNTRKNQRGFGAGLLLFLVATIIAIGIYLIKDAFDSSSASSGDLMGSTVGTVQNGGAAVAFGTNRLVNPGGASLNAITFTGATTSTDVFGSGSANMPSVPAKANPSSGASSWVYYTPGSGTSGTTTVSGAKITNIGNAKNWLALLQVNQQFCQAEANAVFGAGAAIPASGTVDLSTVSNTTTTALDLTGFTASATVCPSGACTTAGQGAGCVQDKNGKWFHYQVILAQ